MDKTQVYAGIILYRTQRTHPEILLFNDTFTHKRHWTPAKGKIVGSETEFNCATRELSELTGLSPKDYRVEENFRTEIKYLADTRPKRVTYLLAQISDHARIVPTGEGINYAWLTQQAAAERAIFRSMNDVLSRSFEFIEKKRLTAQCQRVNNIALGPQHFKTPLEGLEQRFKSMQVPSEIDSTRQTGPAQKPSQGYRSTDRSPAVDATTHGNGIVPNMYPNYPFPRATGVNGDGRGEKKVFNNSTSHESNPLYKTRLCERFETEGQCPYGPKCTFAHGSADLRERPTGGHGPLVHPGWPLNGTTHSTEEGVGVKNKSAESGNPLFKTKLCERFTKEGHCSYGPMCNFAHGETELRERVSESNESIHAYTKKTNVEEKPKERLGKIDWKAREETNIASGVNRHVDLTTSTILRRPPNLIPRTTFVSSDPQTQSIGSSKSTGVGSLAISSANIARNGLGANLMNAGLDPFKSASAETTFLEGENHTNGIFSTLMHPVKLNGVAHSQNGSTTRAANGRVGTTAAGATDTVSLKDLLSHEKLNRNRTVMKVVELSNDEKEKVQTAKKSTNGQPSQFTKEEQLVRDLGRFMKESYLAVEAAEGSRRDKLLADEIKEVTRVEFRNDLSCTQLFAVLVPCLGIAPETLVNNLKLRLKLIKTFVRSPTDQIAWISAWEQFISKTPDFVPKTAMIFKMFYDCEVVEEEVFVRWYEEGECEGVVRRKVKAFIEWLKSAEEED